MRGKSRRTATPVSRPKAKKEKAREPEADDDTVSGNGLLPIPEVAKPATKPSNLSHKPNGHAGVATSEAGPTSPVVPSGEANAPPADDLLDIELRMERPWTVRPTQRLYRLVPFDLAPPWLQFNPFIRTGYRLRYTARMCLTSLFHHHNETGNVWTHFAGILVFLIAAGFVYTRVLEPLWSHWIVFTFFMGACSMCMTCSAIYHLFNCHYNEVIAMRMLKVDLLGIATLIIASFVPFLYFAFACMPQWRVVYLAMIGILGGAGVVAPFVELDEQYHMYRTLLYTAITGSGIFPTLHIAFGFPITGTMLAPISGVALMFLLYGIGLLFYVSRIPERWYPGHFDYWLNSHQIWHMFVLSAAVCHFAACVALYQRYQHMGGEHC